MPLAIVAEKKRRLKMKIKDKKEQLQILQYFIKDNKEQVVIRYRIQRNLLGFYHWKIHLRPLKNKRKSKVQKWIHNKVLNICQHTKKIEPMQFEPPEEFEQQQPQAAISQSSQDFGGFGNDQFGSFGSQQVDPIQPAQFGTFDSNFTTQNSNFNSFAQSNFNQFSQSTTQVQWGDFGQESTKISQKDQQQEQSQKQTKEQVISPVKEGAPNYGVQIQKLMDDATEDFTQESIQKGIENISRALELMQKYLGGASEEKYKKVQKFIVFCATYRFAFQLLVGIKQMVSSKNQKKEIFLFLVLIHLNLKPIHRMHYIIQSRSYLTIFLGIQKCLSYQNSAMAEALYMSLAPNLDKNKPNKEDLIVLSECKLKLDQIKDKQNTNLLKMVCPNCQKHFHFKVFLDQKNPDFQGLKKCSKCSQEFLLCSQTLSCIQKAKALKCLSCESLFSPNSRKPDEQCPICKLGKLQC